MSAKQQNPTGKKPTVSELYKYFTTEGAIATLWGKELMFSPVSEYNDPFEAYPAHPTITDLDTLREEWSDFAQWMGSKPWYVTCLSRSKNNLRMWSQYSECHKGIMITFNRRKMRELRGSILEVKYNQPRVPVFEDMHIKTDKTELPSKLKALMTRKGADWKQEQELRMVLHQAHFGVDNEKLFPPDSSQEGWVFRRIGSSIKAFVPLPKDAISRVTLGWRSDRLLLQTIDRIRENQNANWEMTRAYPSIDGFSLVERSI